MVIVCIYQLKTFNNKLNSNSNYFIAPNYTWYCELQDICNYWHSAPPRTIGFVWNCWMFHTKLYFIISIFTSYLGLVSGYLGLLTGKIIGEKPQKNHICLIEYSKCSPTYFVVQHKCWPARGYEILAECMYVQPTYYVGRQ